MAYAERVSHPNLYFDLTRAFNAHGRVAVLTSGQAVVYYRLAIMSKDGDWIVRETEEACRRILEVLAEQGARYRPGAPLDVRWLAGGWSSHFEFTDPRGRRARCDFFSRAPRVPPEILAALFAVPERREELAVISVEPLIRMKQTQRAKDYPVIGELARQLPPERELELTTDPDRILELAPEHGAGSPRPCVRAARTDAGRLAVVRTLAEEMDHLQQQDRIRVERFTRYSEPYLRAFRALDRRELALPSAHERICALGERLLPPAVPVEDADEDAE